MRRVIVCMCMILCAAGCSQSRQSAGPAEAACWTMEPATRVEAWRQDIDALSAELPKRHKNAFFKRTEEQFRAAAAALRHEVPRLADHEVVVGLMKLAASLGDAHTVVAGFEAKPAFQRFPIEIHIFRDGPVIVAARATQRDLIGTTLLRFGGVPADEAFRRVSAVNAFENEPTYRLNVARQLPFAEIAHAVRLIPTLDRVSIDVRGADGRERSVELTPLTAGESLVGPQIDEATMPLSRQSRPAANWFEALPEKKAVYLRYNTCNDLPGLPVSALCRQVLQAIDTGAAERLVVDLRGNGGGNSSLIAPLIRGLKWRSIWNPRIEVRVLIGRRTFSSAFMNADEMKRELGATLIGEPTGQKPNAYGEVRSFRLPRSHMTVRYSTKFWRRAAGDPPSLEPDIRVESESADFFAPRDRALEAALEER